MRSKRSVGADKTSSSARLKKTGRGENTQGETAADGQGLRVLKKAVGQAFFSGRVSLVPANIVLMPTQGASRRATQVALAAVPRQAVFVLKETSEDETGTKPLFLVLHIIRAVVANGMRRTTTILAAEGHGGC